MEERLAQMYPDVVQDTTSIPLEWNPQDKNDHIVLQQHDTYVVYTGPGKRQLDSAAVRAKHPVPLSCGTFYYEVFVINSGSGSAVGIGYSLIDVNLDRMPGWEEGSYGYHGDDGKASDSTGQGRPYGPTFGTGDVIGCGLDLARGTCFYTKNGRYLGYAFTGVARENWFPTVGTHSHGAVLATNFGQGPFKFDLTALKSALGPIIKKTNDTSDACGSLLSLVKYVEDAVNNCLIYTAPVRKLILGILQHIVYHIGEFLVQVLEYVPILGYLVAIVQLCRGDYDRAKAAALHCTRSTLTAACAIGGGILLGPGGAVGGGAFGAAMGTRLEAYGGQFIKDPAVKSRVAKGTVWDYSVNITFGALGGAAGEIIPGLTKDAMADTGLVLLAKWSKHLLSVLSHMGCTYIAIMFKIFLLEVHLFYIELKQESRGKQIENIQKQLEDQPDLPPPTRENLFKQSDILEEKYDKAHAAIMELRWQRNQLRADAAKTKSGADRKDA